MRDPLRQLRQLPWAAAFASACLAVFLITVLEAILVFVLLPLPSLSGVWELLFSGPLWQILRLVIAALVGALAVLLFERLYGWITLQTGILWALVGCLMVVLFGRSLFGSIIPGLFTSSSLDYLLGVIIGVFWKGRPYW